MSKYKYSVKALAAFLAVAVMAGGMPVSALAATNEDITQVKDEATKVATDETIDETKTAQEIIAFAALPEETANQTVSYGTTQEKLLLPDTMTVTLQTVTKEEELTQIQEEEAINQEEVSFPETKEQDISINWEASPSYDAKTPETYCFTPVIEEFEVKAELPKITVTVKEEQQTEQVSSQQNVVEANQVDISGMGWEITGTELTIETDAGMSDWINKGTNEQKEMLESVVIKEGVSSIGEEVFFLYRNLTSVVIPEGVSSIGDDAFAHCRSLTSIEIPSSVMSIGNEAFYNCSSLTSVVIKEGVSSIGDGAFRKCSSLTSIEIPSSVTSIGNSVFYECSSLTSIEIPSSVTSIGNSVFYECSSLTSIEIPSSVTSIGNEAFRECSSLTSIEIPSSVMSISNYVFLGCSSLISIVIPEGVSSIGDGAFGNCSSLTSIVMPKGVSSIGYGAFSNCSNLTSIVMLEGVSSIGDGAFYNCSSLTSVVIPEGVSSIGASAFDACSSLTEVIFLRTTPPVIENKIFGNCKKLTAIYVPAANVADYKAVTVLSEYTDLIQKIILYHVSANQGSGTGDYRKNATVTIVADSDTNEQVFQSWSSTDKIEFADASNRTTTFIMPENDVTITANYVKIYPINMQNGSTSKNYYKEGDTVTITANTLGGQDFTGWTTNDGITFADAGSLLTTFTMPAKPVTVMANYKASKVEVTGMTLSQTSAALKTGDTITLNASVTPSNATESSVTWSSSNENIATVDENGTVTGKGIGSAIITATSNSNTALTAACTINVSIGKVTGLTAKINNTTSITLTWEEQNNVDGYKVYRYDSSKKKYVKIATIKKDSTVTYKDKKRRVATTYKYKVRAYVTIDKKTKYGSYSSSLKTATKSKKPSISTKAGSKKATLTWNKVNSVSGYEIYMSTKKNSDYTKIKTVSAKTTKYTKKKLTKKKTYYFKIRTYKTVDGVKIYSSYSSVKKVKIK